jgi:nucleoside-diphosphate-sugar epimerase
MPVFAPDVTIPLMILVTGATGFIGRSVMAWLERAGKEVPVFKGHSKPDHKNRPGNCHFLLQNVIV